MDFIALAQHGVTKRGGHTGHPLPAEETSQAPGFASFKQTWCSALMAQGPGANRVAAATPELPLPARTRNGRHVRFMFTAEVRIQTPLSVSEGKGRGSVPHGQQARQLTDYLFSPPVREAKPEHAEARPIWPPWRCR